MFWEFRCLKHKFSHCLQCEKKPTSQPTKYRFYNKFKSYSLFHYDISFTALTGYLSRKFQVAKKERPYQILLKVTSTSLGFVLSTKLEPVNLVIQQLLIRPNIKNVILILIVSFLMWTGTKNLIRSFMLCFFFWQFSNKY